MWQQRTYKKEDLKELMSYGHSKITSLLLAQRNISPVNSKRFLSHSYEDISSPHNLNGVKEAAQLFCNVALKKGRVAIIGDYDADGVFSSIMLKELCNVFKLKCDTFLPSRFDHGYGLTENGISAFKELVKTPPDLLFISDCGSSSEKEVKELKEWGIKHIIIIDHHIIDESKISKSADVLINWHLQDNYDETCACGEVFQFIRGIRWLTKKVNPIEFISYAATGILADVSPIIGDNRIIVKNGLNEHALNNITASGFNALIRKSGIFTPNVSQGDILFKIAPRINAIGRLDKPNMAFNLLIETDPTMSELMADNLSDFNNKRKKMQKQIESEAMQMILKDESKYENGILLIDEKWPVGVVGIVASKLTETLFKPTVIVGKNGDVYKGSGRSLNNINLKEILDDCKHIFDNHGGHAMAAGVVLKKEYIDKANEIFNESCKKYYETNGKPQQIRYYDAVLEPKHITLENAQKLLDTVYPYCQQFNPEPVFCLKDAILVDVEHPKRGEYKILSFNASKNEEKTKLRFKMFTEKFGTEISGSKADIYFSFPQVIYSGELETYNQINVLDIILK